MDSVLTGECYLFLGRWCVIGPCVGVQQAGTALCNPGSVKPSAMIHLSRIPVRTSRYPYMPGVKTKLKTDCSKGDTKKKSFPLVEESLCSGSFHRSD